MLKKEYELSSSFGKVLYVTSYQPEKGPVKKILHVIHGLTEHMGRYESFARELVKEGIMVVGFDLAGHGKDSRSKDVASFKEGEWLETIENLHFLHEKMIVSYPETPYYMLGFSLGSFLLREYLSNYSQDIITKAILIGTGEQSAFVLNMVMGIVEKEIKKVGFENSSKIIQDLSFGQYNKKFEPHQTEMDWLLEDQNMLEKYINDPLCKKQIASGLFYELLGSMKRSSQKDTYTSWDKKIPILLLSGTNDPVGDMGKGILKLEKKMKKNRVHVVDVKLLAHARHDVLHEEKSGANKQAIEAILSFLKK